MKLLTTWFENNYMASNDDKCKLIITNEENSFANIGKEKITCSQSIKLLGVMIDNKLNFKHHVSKICKKASQKIHALARISNYMNQDKLRTVMKAFIESQFGYCTLMWMFHSRTLNNRINKLHERALHLVYKNDDCTFEE